MHSWFEILRALGSYPGEDDPSVVSRTSRWLATRFPNGALAVGAHYRDHIESWPGGFHRDAQQDEQALAANPLPPDELELTGLRLAGRRVDFRGRLLVAFREDDRHRLAAFAGYEAERLSLDGREHVFADRPMPMLGWAPVRADRRVAGGAVLEVWIQGEGRLRLPLTDEVVVPRLFVAGQRPGTVGAAVPARVDGGILEFEAGPGKAQGKLFLLQGVSS